MSDQCYQSLSIGQMRWNAMIDALSAPGPAIGLTMAGYSTIAREAGFNFWMSLATSLGIWGLPGQVVLVSLYATGASLFIIFVAVSLANLRMLLMVISAADMMDLASHKLPLWKRVFWMHFLSITSWTNLGIAQQKYPSHLLLAYYQGFTLTIFFFGILGTILGYFLGDLLEPEFLRIVIFITPIYILLNIINARHKANRLAVVLGSILCPILFPIAGEWAILLAGLVGGAIASLYSRYDARLHSG
ncbi:MAG: AzlC family ABC transporter permease [Paracoccaceae bacterium]|jgi:predicted branched-subunit amino acid permease